MDRISFHAPCLIGLIGVLTILMSSCAKNDAQVVNDQLKQVVSWSATAELVSQSWLNGAVPEKYAHRTLEAINHELEKNVKELQSVTANSEVLLRANSVLQTIVQMDAALQQKDRSSLVTLIASLSREEEAVKASFNAPKP